jgi:hypothetical protein
VREVHGYFRFVPKAEIAELTGGSTTGYPGTFFVVDIPSNAWSPADSEASGTKLGPGRLRSKGTARQELVYGPTFDFR